jgi:cation transport ATPase
VQKSASEAKGVEASGQLKITRAQDIPAGKGPGYKPMIVPTVAVALAALEAVPVAVVGSVVALAALPIARRVGAGVRSRKITVDELDLANVAWLALQGEFLVAGIIAWLISLGELIRGRTVRYARQEISRLAALAERGEARPDLGERDHARRVLEAIRNAPLSDTRVENVSTKAANSLSLPVFAAAVAAFLLTRDPADFISIMKPRTDFAFGQGFSVPATLLNAVTATTPQGPLFTGGSALERLARVDAVVFAGGGASLGEAPRKSLANALLDRGIRRLLIPNAPPAGRGRPRARTELLAERTEAMVLRLKEQGYTVAVVGDRVDDSPAFREADIRISLDRDPDITRSRADVVLLRGDISALPIAVDVARETMRIVRQNTAVAAGAAAVNLTTALLRISPAPLSTIINTGSIAIVGMNALRPFYPALPEPAASQRPTALLAEGARA